MENGSLHLGISFPGITGYKVEVTMQDVPSLRKVHHSYLPLLMLLAQQSPSLGENPLFEKQKITHILST